MKKNHLTRNLISFWKCSTEVNLCDPDPCQNMALCTNFRISYTCDCLPGFSGVNCQSKNCFRLCLGVKLNV